MKLIIQRKMLMSMMLAAVFGIAWLGGSDALAKCDLKVTFIAPTGNTVTAGQAVTWRLQFKNIGKTTCKANRIKLSRYSGRTGRGYGSAIGGSGNLEKLPALAPGESVDLSFVEKKPPSKGTYTYKIRFSSPHNDANNRNHGPTKTVTFKRSTTRRRPISRGKPKSVGLCDLKTTFIAPTGNTVTGGQAVTWTLKFENIGAGQCAANTIRLRRYSGNTASGYGTAIGGSGNLETLPALAAAGSVNLSFVENNPPNTGTYTYKASYSSPHNDGNNFNHHPTKTVTFQAGAAPGPGGGTPTIPPFISTGPLPNTPIRPGGSFCLPSSVDLVSQTNTMTLAMTLDAGGFIDVVAITATSGTYTFFIQNLMPDCSAPLGSRIGPITVTYGFNYAGSFFRGQAICIDASRLTFTAFSVSGIAVLDNIIAGALKDNIHRRVDFELANRMNSLLNGGPLPGNAVARCNNWILLPPNVAPGF